MTLLTLLGLERALAASGLDAADRWPLVVLLLLPCLELLQGGVDAVFTRCFKDPPPMPRMDPERVLSRETRTLVVTPLLVASLDDIETQLRRLERNFQGNVSPELFFALLTDFPDASQKELPEEAGMLLRLEDGIRLLNARHCPQEAPRFFLLHRERRWNPVARRWMGWERKRGKLEELNRLVLGADDTSYVGPVPGVVRTFRYVITLDADTHLLPGSAARLVAVLHHPLNQARFDGDSQRVVSGYSMLQPGLRGELTRPAWLAMRGVKTSLFRRKTRERTSLSQRAFGIDEFVGKGIYDVAAFARSLEGRIPENAVLSHDKLEGMFSRVAHVPEIQMFEGRVTDIAGTARIWHRWTRGDWQLLPWLLPGVPTRGGRWVVNPLSVIDRWRIFTDMRRSLSAPWALLVVTYGWLWTPGSTDAWAWTLGVAGWFCRRPVLGSLMFVAWTVWRLPPPRHVPRFLLSTAYGTLLDALMELAVLLPLAGVMMDAIARALYRMGVDRTRILDWTTHSQANQKLRAISSLMLPEFWRAALLALVIAGALATMNPGSLPWASPMLVAWVPLLVFARKDRAAPPLEEGQGAPAELARRCWTLYARACDSRDADAKPTAVDAALGLVAPLCAHHLGCLESAALVSRLDEALGAVERLERFRGHPLTGGGLRGLSTSESGMLASALIVLESALEGMRRAGVASASIEACEARARALREGMDFAFLHDASSGLLHEGHDVGAGTPAPRLHAAFDDAGLLASFVAIAEGQLPLRHWQRLLESHLETRGAGTPDAHAAVEQLAPSVFLWFPPATLLEDAARPAVETASRPEASLHLQALALRFKPGSPVDGLQALLEAEPLASPRSLGLTLLALTNLACDDILIQHFHRHWRIAWIDVLVYETKEAP
ncbi:hypothetical protein [Corallococcus sp. AB038B]|uniref:hypothetical protein n=1 Tax=Corallococcus sp. AB038B TaxID=2316718 RepID=UPI000EBA70E4|nr:hypothetical protein [Corallococcus sp. AB038B]RKH97022.1 hypothetical protein D7Y04_27800 [Corallococcus sp. AB038B]